MEHIRVMLCRDDTVWDVMFHEFDRFMKGPSTVPTRLIVSVRSTSEASDALAGGADVIDVKDPERGSLGRAHRRIWQAVLDCVAGARPVSVAMGELLEGQETQPPVPPPSIAFAKYGLSGCGGRWDWQETWNRSIDLLEPRTAAVAVIYADWRDAMAPRPEVIIDAASASGCSIILFDTFIKSGQCLFDHLSLARLRPLVRRIRQTEMLIALAGSLSESRLVTALRLAPDFVAVRGAACRGSRRGPIDWQRVRRLKTVICESARNAPLIA